MVFKNLVEFQGVLCHYPYYSLKGWVGGLEKAKTHLRNKKMAHYPAYFEALYYLLKSRAFFGELQSIQINFDEKIIGI